MSIQIAAAPLQIERVHCEHEQPVFDVLLGSGLTGEYETTAAAVAALARRAEAAEGTDCADSDDVLVAIVDALGQELSADAATLVRCALLVRKSLSETYRIEEL